MPLISFVLWICILVFFLLYSNRCSVFFLSEGANYVSFLYSSCICIPVFVFLYLYLYSCIFLYLYSSQCSVFFPYQGATLCFIFVLFLYLYSCISIYIPVFSRIRIPAATPFSFSLGVPRYVLFLYFSCIFSASFLLLLFLRSPLIGQKKRI